MNEIKLFLADNLSGFSPKAIPSFIFSFFVCALLAYILGKFYVRFGNSLSNRKSFARNFIVLAITTMFIISVVKSSLALSLGLVGALSIVRFRSAVKEPEELIYLFLTIAYLFVPYYCDRFGLRCRPYHTYHNSFHWFSSCDLV
jgi:hypothetical protein